MPTADDVVATIAPQSPLHLNESLKCINTHTRTHEKSTKDGILYWREEKGEKSDCIFIWYPYIVNVFITFIFECKEFFFVLTGQTRWVAFEGRTISNMDQVEELTAFEWEQDHRQHQPPNNGKSGRKKKQNDCIRFLRISNIFIAS